MVLYEESGGGEKLACRGGMENAYEISLVKGFILPCLMRSPRGRHFFSLFEGGSRKEIVGRDAEQLISLVIEVLKKR
jgi:hypothetical protein